jgi:hypothetical protein
MFEKSKSATTFKEFQNTLNVINNFENEWGHFCDPDNNNNINNIIQNNFYQPTKIKEPIKIKEKETIKIKEKETIKIKEKETIKIKEKETMEQIEKEIMEQIEKEEQIKEKIKEQIKINIIKNIFNYTILISISTSFYVIYKLLKT